MIYKTINLVDFEKALDEHIATNKECKLNCLPAEDGIIILTSTTSDYNKEFVDNMSDKHYIVNSRHVGGTIVVFKDAITLVSFQSKNEYKPTWLLDLQTLIRSKGYHAFIDGNDLIVEGKKVCGFSKRSLEKTNFYGTQISINADPELIANICVKDSKKVPVGLSEFGITREMVLEALGIEEK